VLASSAKSITEKFEKNFSVFQFLYHLNFWQRMQLINLKGLINFSSLFLSEPMKLKIIKLLKFRDLKLRETENCSQKNCCAGHNPASASASASDTHIRFVADRRISSAFSLSCSGCESISSFTLSCSFNALG